MATFRQLSEEIQEELGGDAQNDLSGKVDQAILDAIENYEQEAFCLTYGDTVTVTTIEGTDKYPLPANVMSLDGVTYFNGGQTTPLTPRSWEDFLRLRSQQSSFVGPSTDFTIFGRFLYLFPNPNEVTTVTLSGTLRPSPSPFVIPTNDNDSNFWTEEARNLIKSRAKWDIYANQLNDPVNASKQEVMAEFYMGRLVARVEALQMTGVYRPKAYF